MGNAATWNGNYEYGVHTTDITETLRSLALNYPERLRDHQTKDVPRIAYHLDLVLSRKGKDATVCDIGGGVGLFSLGAAALGMSSTLVDDFGEDINLHFGDELLAQHRREGVEIVRQDVMKEGLQFAPESFDVITSFDSIEHWHGSPKRVLHQCLSALKPDGIMIIGVPNCVNLRKRITVPLGIGKWSSMAEWYEASVFRGHVREPDISDLRYIARDLGLSNVRIFGRNWLGHESRFPFVRLLTPVFDYPLRSFPSLCSNLYLVGTRGNHTTQPSPRPPSAH